MSLLAVGSTTHGRVASIDALVDIDNGLSAAEDGIITYVADEPGLYRLSCAGVKTIGAGATAYIQWKWQATGLFGDYRIGQIFSDQDPSVDKLELQELSTPITFSGSALVPVFAAPTTIIFNVEGTALGSDDLQYYNHMYIEKL